MVPESSGLPSEPLTPLAPLSQGERGENRRRSGIFFFLPPLPPGEEGRGGEGFGGHAAAIQALSGHISTSPASTVTIVPASPCAMRTRSASAPMAAGLPVRSANSLAASTFGPIEPPAKG